MNNDSIDRLDSLAFAWQASGLAMMKSLLKTMGNPHEDLQVIHVAWTNGKGSTCAMIAATLTRAGYRTGLFVSPHLETMHERVQIDGTLITDAELEQHLSSIFSIADRHSVTLSFFEALTLVAVFYFLENDVEYAVFEVGLGWTHDSTNLRPQPVATAITSISIDHQKRLWSTLTQIQRNKMWIMKRNVPLYTPVDNPLMHYAARIKWADLRIIRQYDYRDSALEGEHQRINAWVAWAILSQLWLSKEQIIDGLMHTTHRGRLQRIAPNILIDWAHNRWGFQTLCEYIDTIRTRFSSIRTVFGSVKNEQELIDSIPYLLHWDKNYIVLVDSERSLRLSTIQKIFEAEDPATRYEYIVSYDELYSSILSTLPSDTLLVIYWSLYLIGDILKERHHSE